MIKDSIKIENNPCMAPSVAAPSILHPSLHEHKWAHPLVKFSCPLGDLVPLLSGYKDPHAPWPLCKSNHMPLPQAFLSLYPLQAPDQPVEQLPSAHEYLHIFTLDHYEMDLGQEDICYLMS